MPGDRMTVDAYGNLVIVAGAESDDSFGCHSGRPGRAGEPGYGYGSGVRRLRLRATAGAWNDRRVTMAKTSKKRRKVDR
jgi:hypothetical protein